MSIVNYEQLVKSVYPNAHICCWYLFGLDLYYVEDLMTGNCLSSKNNHEPSDAWQSAYETLKQQNKL